MLAPWVPDMVTAMASVLRSGRRGAWIPFLVVATLGAPIGALAAPPRRRRHGGAARGWPAAADGPSASDIFLLVDWEITNPRVNWRLDQKVVAGLKLQSEVVAAEENRLKALVTKSVNTESSSAVRSPLPRTPVPA